MRILIIEDNRDLATNIGDYLESKGHILDFAEDGVTGLHLATTTDNDVIVLDLMLPGLDGLEVCRRLRDDARKHTPVLMLTARDTLDDKLDGFEVGGDDYLIKPFSLLELEARLLALTRRSERSGQSHLLKVADLEYDPATLIVKRKGKTINLKPTTRKILEVLIRASPRVVGRAEIEAKVWHDEPPVGDALRAHIYMIRNAIDKPFDVKLVHTVHGAGYCLASPHER